MHIASDENISEIDASVGIKFNSCGDIWGASDGLKINFDNPGHRVIQNIFYNGWSTECYIDCVFIFGADGAMHIAVINSPGALHDSNQYFFGNACEKVDAIFERTGFRVNVDSAFNM